VSKADEPTNAAKAFTVVDIAGWSARLARSDKGVLLPVVENVVSILLNDERWAGVIAYDEFAGLVMKRKPPPFDRGEVGEWTDFDDARLELWLATHHAMRKLSNETTGNVHLPASSFSAAPSRSPTDTLSGRPLVVLSVRSSQSRIRSSYASPM